MDNCVLVVGGLGVLGEAITRRYLRLGWKVMVTTTSAARGEAGVVRILKDEQLEASQLCFGVMDMANEDSVRAFAANYPADFPRPCVIVKSAGGNRKEANLLPDQPLSALPVEAMLQMMHDYYGGLLRIVKHLSSLLDQNGGVFVSIGSMAGIRPLSNIPGYSANMAAEHNFMQWLSWQYASDKIRFVVVAPGFVLTEQNRHMLIDSESGAQTARGKKITDHTPLERFGTPEEVAHMVCAVAENSFMSGAIVPVCGGFSSGSGI